MPELHQTPGLDGSEKGLDNIESHPTSDLEWSFFQRAQKTVHALINSLIKVINFFDISAILPEICN